MAIWMSNFDNFDIDQISSKLAQRNYLTCNFYRKKIYILYSLDNAKNPKWKLFLNHPIFVLFALILWRAPFILCALERSYPTWYRCLPVGVAQYSVIFLLHQYLSITWQFVIVSNTSLYQIFMLQNIVLILEPSISSMKNNHCLVPTLVAVCCLHNSKLEIFASIISCRLLDVIYWSVC